jgi:hypothetical protein
MENSAGRCRDMQTCTGRKISYRLAFLRSPIFGTPSSSWMHGGGQRLVYFKYTAMDGFSSQYYVKYEPESWKNFLVQEFDA